MVATVRADTTERWIFENRSGGWFHPIHVHLVDFQIVSRNDRPAFPYESGLKDVVYVGPNERVELLMRFIPARQVDPGPNHAPVVGKYVMHCHNTVHEDHDMMTEFDDRGGRGPGGARDTDDGTSAQHATEHDGAVGAEGLSAACQNAAI